MKNAFSVDHGGGVSIHINTYIYIYIYIHTVVCLGAYFFIIKPYVTIQDQILIIGLGGITVCVDVYVYIYIYIKP